MAYPNSATKNLTAQLRLKGGVAARTLTGAVTCDASTESICFWDPGGASRDVTLPAEETSDGLFFIFKNEADAAENLVIKDDAAATVVTINQSEWAIVACDGTTWQDVPFSALADYLATSNAWTGTQTFQNVIFGAASELTIATGAVAATRSYHTLDTEADAASDDLDDITGLAAGEVLLVSPASAARTVVLKHAIGANKIACPGGRDISLAESTDWAMLVSDGTQAVVLAFSTLAKNGGGIGSALASVANGLGASLIGIEDSGAKIVAATVEGALAEIAAETEAIVAENTDVAIPIDLSNRIDVSGTWTLSRTGAGIYRLRRTAAGAVEASAFRAQPRERTSASKGFKVSGFVMKYAITTADPVDVTVDGVFTPMPATGAAVAAATSLGAVTYDAAHDTAAERKAVGEHTMTGTFVTPVYLNGKDEVELLVTVDSTGLATPVIDLYKIVLTGSETLVELA